MATPATGTEVIQLARRFHASREKVFAAWTQPQLIERWLCRTVAEARVRVVAQDLRVGGQYRIEIDGHDGKPYALAGEYRELRSPERLAFTWQWVHEPGDAVSLVTVEIRDAGGSSEVLLRHENLSAASREGHRGGWEACFDRLATEMNW